MLTAAHRRDTGLSVVNLSGREPVMAKRKDSITDLTADRARLLFDYDAEAGQLKWRNPTARCVKAGDVAGSLNKKTGQRQVWVDERSYPAHRIVWLVTHGRWPHENLSAKNGNYDDLRLDNLVEKTAAETATRSDAKGVYLERHTGKWRAEMRRNYEIIPLGRHSTKEEAEAAYAAGKAHHSLPTANDDVRKLRADKSRFGYRLRGLWNRLGKDYATTGWSSFSDFATEIGDKAGAYMRIRPADERRLVGPGNWRMERMAKFDRKTPEGRTAYQKFKNETSRDRRKCHELRTKFGIPLERYREMLLAQNGVCASCKRPEVAAYKGRVRALSVDHCHATGAVRDLLCHSCNHGIGVFREDPAALRAAADYLERHAAKAQPTEATGASNVVPMLKPKSG